MEEADKMFEEVVQVEKIACFLGSWWGGSANLSNFIKGKCHMGKWHIIALFEQINTDHKKQQSKVLVAALSMLDVSYFVVDCERSIWAVDRHQAIWKKIIVIGDSHQQSLNTLQLAILFACPVFTGESEKEYRGYNSSFDWPGAKFPRSCLTLRVPKVLRHLGADHNTTLGKCENNMLNWVISP